MKLKDCNFKLNIKSCMLFEMLTGKSLFEATTEEDISKLMYSTFITNNDIRIGFEAFLNLLDEKEIVDSFTKEFQFTYNFMNDMAHKEEEGNTSTSGNTQISMKITDVAMNLIVKYGLDAHYVNYEMELWEISPIMKAIEDKYKTDMEERRMWAYINVMPHIDSKKCKSPDKLLPFPWEKADKAKKAMKDLQKNTEASKSVFEKMNLNLNLTENERRESDTDNEQTRLDEIEQSIKPIV